MRLGRSSYGTWLRRTVRELGMTTCAERWDFFYAYYVCRFSMYMHDTRVSDSKQLWCLIKAYGEGAGDDYLCREVRFSMYTLYIDFYIYRFSTYIDFYVWWRSWGWLPVQRGIFLCMLTCNSRMSDYMCGRKKCMSKFMLELGVQRGEIFAHINAWVNLCWSWRWLSVQRGEIFYVFYVYRFLCI